MSGAYAANPVIRIEVSQSDGDYDFYINDVFIRSFTPTNAGGAGSNYLAFRGSNANDTTFDSIDVNVWSEGGGGYTGPYWGVVAA